MNHKFKKGDQVRNKKSGEIDIVKSVPGMPEYDKRPFLDASEGFVLEKKTWEYQDRWEFAGRIASAHPQHLLQYDGDRCEAFSSEKELRTRIAELAKEHVAGRVYIVHDIKRTRTVELGVKITIK